MASKPYNAQEITRELRDASVEIIRDGASAFLSTAVLATPVGNPSLWRNPQSAPPGYVGGHARRNWQVGQAVAPSDERAGEDSGGFLTIAQGKAEIGRYRRLVRLWVVNNAPYIGRLNDGHSTQAPVGFVERALARAVRTGINARIEL